MFLTIDVFAQKILNIVGSQIEIYIFFTLARILTNLERCRLQIEKNLKLIF